MENHLFNIRTTLYTRREYLNISVHWSDLSTLDHVGCISYWKCQCFQDLSSMLQTLQENSWSLNIDLWKHMITMPFTFNPILHCPRCRLHGKIPRFVYTRPWQLVIDSCRTAVRRHITLNTTRQDVTIFIHFPIYFVQIFCWIFPLIKLGSFLPVDDLLVGKIPPDVPLYIQNW